MNQLYVEVIYLVILCSELTCIAFAEDIWLVSDDCEIQWCLWKTESKAVQLQLWFWDCWKCCEWHTFYLQVSNLWS